MKPHHFPSTSALRYLAWLTRPSSTTPTILPLRHHRPFSLSAQCPVERSSSARSPRARKAARQTGSSFAAANHKNRDSLRAFEDVLLSKWVMRDFEELGLKPYTNWSNSPQVFVLDTFLGTMKNGNSPAGVARWFTGQHTNDEGKTFAEGSWRRTHPDLSPLALSSIIGSAIWALGYQFVMSPSKTQRELGQYMVKVAVIMGVPAATLHVIWSHRQGGAIEPTPIAFNTLAWLSDALNIHAMCLRAETLAWPKPSNRIPTAAQRAEAYDLALKAFLVSEANKPIAAPPPPRVAGPVGCVPQAADLILPGYLLLQRLGPIPGNGLPPTAPLTWSRAVLAGAFYYDDADSCLLAIDPVSALVPVGSAKWVLFAKKAAIAGKANASLRLGQYFLELHEWYPPNAALRGRERMGFYWVEVSVAQMGHPEEVQVNAFAMAILCRENAEIKEARRWLEVGLGRCRELEGEDGGAAERFFEECLADGWWVEGGAAPPGWSVEETYFPDKLLEKAKGEVEEEEG